ncbi:NUDIX domain-containing protein [Fulvivirgaceae bacterium BMA12]|uniref:8-oxo-dGTP diphosphatase n=1 Tax=Agaribacillus aureus TaxID=3051825 RepID=A0ABT8LA34_9BACT|nr:NUDIX domain-containing protein [Fulvivirgaceae bacterium BMA12]
MGPLRTKTIDCAAFILLKGQEILVEKRKMSKQTDPGKVAIPSGKAEAGEDIRTTCKREMEEELNIKPLKLEFLTEELHDNGLYYERIHYFVCTDWKGEVQPLEAEQVYWVNSNQLDALELQADRKAISKLLKL